MKRRTIKAADLFCGAGGTSDGLIRACERMGYEVELTAINHWDVAIATHSANHPTARHLCTSIDNINPRHLFKEGELDVLWASPECTHHSVARGGKPINDQSRATAWCVTRWAEALRPSVILVENVPEFLTWGELDVKGRPKKEKKGGVFHAWIETLRAIGYRVEWKILCAADYGDPTTRRRLFVQAVRGRRKVVWPEATHGPVEEGDLFGKRKRWVPAREIIDWNLPAPSIYDRKRPLSEKTMNRIMEGLKKFGLNPSVICMEHGGKVDSVDAPVRTITTARGGAMAVATPFIMSAGGPECPARSVEEPVGTVLTRDHRALVHPYLVELRGTSEDQVRNSPRSLEEPISAVATSGAHHALAEPFLVQVNHQGGDRTRSVEVPLPTVCGNRGEWALCQALLPQHGGGVLRPVTEPAPTVTTDGAIGLVSPYLVKFYGTANGADINEPLDTVTAKDRFGLARPRVIVDGQEYILDIGFRMLQPHELAAAQGFRKDYQFTGTKTDQVKQIGNAVPGNLAEALVRAVLTQNSEISDL